MKNKVLSKKSLIEVVKRRLSEAPPIDYGDNPERMNPDIERRLADKDHPFKDNPALPTEKPEGLPSNFEELIASKRFVTVVNKVKEYTGIEGNVTDQNAFAQLQRMMMETLRHVLAFESTRKEELEQMGIEMVKKEMAIPEGALQFDAKIVGLGEVSHEGFQSEPENPSEEEVEQQFGVDGEEAEEDIEEFMDAFEVFNAETAKRRFLNALIQGSSKKGHYMFELAHQELTQMDPTIVNKYGVLMSVNDLLYWLFPDEMMLGGGGAPIAGKEEINKETDPPTVVVRAVFFPALVHELIKGVMEVMATKGLPDDKRSADMVMGVTDTLPGEIWDLRLGPTIWEKFIESYPDRIFEEDKKHLQNYLFARFSALSAKEFFKLAKLILKGDRLGKEIIERMVSEIEEHLRGEDWAEAEHDLDDDSDDGLGGFLNSLGIDLPDDDQ